MEKLMESLKDVHPGRYDLRAKEMTYIYDNYGHDLCKVMGVVFKIGFLRGQKAMKKAVKNG